jgi:hypothetical protein
MERTVKRRALVVLALLIVGCGTSSTGPDEVTSRIVITAVSPPAGSTVVVPPEYPYHTVGGVVLPPGSGLISVDLDIRVAHEVPWAQLYVYLLSDAQDLGYCGQNLPDAPTWGSLPAGWTTSVTVSGFQLQLPCDVTGVRAMLHTRNNGLLTPPTAAETIAEATFPVTLQLRR